MSIFCMKTINNLFPCKHKASPLALLLLAWIMLLSAMPAWADDIGKYELKVVAKPTKAGSFNTNKDSLSAGQMVELYAYANSNFSFKEWVDEQGKVVSDKQNFQYNMPAHNVTLTAIYTFDPANPSNPNKNFWDRTTGNVIADDFKAGSLQSAISQATGSGNASKVLAITVAGRINSNDFGIANTYSNCTTLDLSRTTGVSEVPSYAFDYTKLQTVTLPATIDKIGYEAFYRCSQLSSLTCYAMTPPTVGGYAFYGVQEDMVVFVPAAAVAQYQEAAGWKGFTILPIQNDIRTIKVSLPQDANIADYANMYLELTNTKSGQRLHYVMTDKREYAFANIIKNTAWNVTLRNERGDVFGEIRNVEVKDEDAAVNFDKLKKPQHINLQVLTPNGDDVTAQTSITWTTVNGEYLAQGDELNGFSEGSKMTYNIALSQSLSMLYSAPSQGIHVAKQDSNNIVCYLNTLSQIIIKGNVKDATTGMAINNATVSASQTFGGKYGKTIGTQTDEKGNYTFTAFKVPTTLTIASTDYISKVLTCDSLMALNADTITAQQVLLRPIEGATIALDFNYRTCADSTDDVVQNWYSDYNNIVFTIYNKTKQCAISNFSMQYPRIVLLDEVSVGDVLTIEASSKTNDFMPISLTTKVDSTMLATASFEIVEKGQIRASFAQNDNEQVVGSLYDADGKLIKTADYNNASLTFTNLSDGNYTLVTMGKSTLFNTIYDLSKLTETGLIEGTDYVVNNLIVKSGEITTLSIDNVPTLNESKLYYTGDNTLFAVNKPSIVVGNYLTLSAQLDFKQAYAKDVSNVNVVVDLPTSCQFVENSVMVGNDVSTYTCNGSRITIPVANYADRVRFCIIPTQGGDYAPSALVQFNLKGKSIMQPIGAANYTANNLSIVVPSLTAETTIPISGTAIGKSDIKIYDNDILIGETQSLANGIWSTTCPLYEPYNLSIHSIRAEVITKSGLNLTSEATNCAYDMNAIQVSKVTMLNTAHTSQNLNLYEYKTIFDFQHPQTSYPPYWYWPKYPDFTFLVEFTRNDTTIVSDVELQVLLSNNTVKTLKPTFDIKRNCWVATDKFMSSALPTTVNVTFDANIAPIIDANELSNIEDSNTKEYSKSVEERKQALNEWNKEEELPNKELWDKLDKLLDAENIEADSVEIDNLLAQLIPNAKVENYNNIDSLIAAANDSVIAYQKDKKELTNNFNDVLDNYLAVLGSQSDDDDSFDYSYSTFGGQTQIVRDKLNAIDEEYLLSKGYAKYDKTDGSALFILYSDSAKVIIDSKTLYRTTISTYAETKAIKLKEVSDVVTCLNNIKNAIKSLQDLRSDLQNTEDKYKLVRILSDIKSCYEDVYEAFECTYDQGIKGAKRAVQKAYELSVNLLQKHKSSLFKRQGELESAVVGLRNNIKYYENLTKQTSNNISRLNVALKVAETDAEKKKILDQIDIEKFWLENQKNTLSENRKTLSKAKNELKNITKELKNIDKEQKLVKNAYHAAKSFISKVPTSIKAARHSKNVKILGRVSKVVGTTIGAVLQLIPTALDILDSKDQMSEWISLLKKELAKYPCENDANRWSSIWNRSVASTLGFAYLSIQTIQADIAGMVLDATNDPNAQLASICVDLYSFGISFAKDKLHDKAIKTLEKELKELKCKRNNDDNRPINDGWKGDGLSGSWPLPKVEHVMDPSGYVYESVLSNRLEGVKATVYYKELVEDMYGDLHENIVKWNAEEYAQKNPLFTDENGFYRWDVPQGLWQVKFEKEGYETTYSDWLPVPPPQLDVNIGMKQNVQPNVKDAKAYEDAVELTFDKYMMADLLNTDNIIVAVNNKTVNGHIELLNEEADYNDKSKHYASKLRFNADKPFDAATVTLIVKNQVKSYAGIRMESDYMQSFVASKEIKRIECDSAVSIDYGKSKTIDIAVLPAAAAAGKEVEVNLSSNLIISTNTTKCTLNEEGHAQIVVNGELPGMAAITFKLADKELSATTIISVKEMQKQPVAAPTANITTGSTIEKGTAITLHCSTEGAQIYYTLDGSCPCDNTEARKLYDGTPILINADTEIKAMACMDGEESEVVTFFYKVLIPDNVSNASAKGIKVYPTLVKDILNVDISESTKGYLFITDTNGRQILNIDNAKSHNTINMTGLTSGMYVVVVRTEDGKCTTKIIKL